MFCLLQIKQERWNAVIQLKVRVHAGGGIAIGHNVHQGFIPIHQHKVRTGGSKVVNGIGQNAVRLAQQVLQLRYLVMSPGVILRQDEFHVTGQGFHGTERLAQFVREMGDDILG